MRYGKRTSSCFAVLSLAGALLVMQSAGGAELPLLPGIGAVDRRVAVDPGQPPWNAIAKVQTNIGTRCTGALIAPGTVLTAAHCLYNRRTQALLQAGSLHVLLGYNRGDYRWRSGLQSERSQPNETNVGRRTAPWLSNCGAAACRTAYARIGTISPVGDAGMAQYLAHASMTCRRLSSASPRRSASSVA